MLTSNFSIWAINEQNIYTYNGDYNIFFSSRCEECVGQHSNALSRTKRPRRTKKEPVKVTYEKIKKHKTHNYHIDLKLKLEIWNLKFDIDLSNIMQGNLFVLLKLAQIE